MAEGIDTMVETVKYNNRHELRFLWERRFKELKSFTNETYIFSKRIIFTADPENIKALLASQFNDFGKGEDFRLQWHPFLGDSIFATDGKQWQESRHLIRPQFIKDRVSDLHTFERHFQLMLPHLPAAGQTFEVSNLLYRLTLDTATDFLLGSSVDSLTNPKAQFATSFAYIQAHMNHIMQLGPLWKLYQVPAFKRHLAVLNNFVEPFVQRTLEMRPEDLKEKSETDYNFLHALAQYTRDPRMLRDQLVAVLLAARDTTAAQMSWGMHELSRRPDCVQRLRHEILQHVGPDKAPTYSDLKEMKYLQHVMNEILRLYPGVPFNVRTALKDTTLPRGNVHDDSEPIGVLAGQRIAYSTLTMQRRKDLFGEDVNEFRPERWEEWQPKPWQYVPFNGGPRLCIGQQFALTEMGYFWTRFFQKVERLENRSVGNQKEKCEIVLTTGEPVLVAVAMAE